ncbi:claudin-4 [Sparus aurata]|uniref:Claudin 32b n=1 Tax=Lateolabrax maculatus TaxID=315492 RepID=A0A8X8M427_LATMC|nr:claudin-4-like [Sparus aurata]XP_036948335.1 claudin-4 [Acanthopagrus latus]URX57517.1 claudin 32b [Lateolabrax maculatus]
MVNTGMQLISFTCAVTGWIMAIAVTALPQWKVSAFIGSNILTSEIKWEGIWMNCIYQTTGHMQCKTYDSMLALPPDIQAARALMCLAIFMGWLSCTVSCCGMKCTTCAGDDRRAKAGIALSGGVLFILTGLCVLIPVSWTANTVVQDFYNPNVPLMHKRELGQAIYLGWASAVILMISGAVLSSTCPLMERGGRYRRGYIGRSFANSPASAPDPPKPITSNSLPLKEYV